MFFKNVGVLVLWRIGRVHIYLFLIFLLSLGMKELKSELIRFGGWLTLEGYIYFLINIISLGMKVLNLVGWLTGRRFVTWSGGHALIAM